MSYKSLSLAFLSMIGASGIQICAMDMMEEEVVMPAASLDMMMKPEMQNADIKENNMINIGLDANVRNSVAQLLHKLLSNEYMLYVKTQKFHWNVKGPFFGPLHKLFNEQYDALASIIDSMAERSLALGVPSIGTLKEFINLATLQEAPEMNPSHQEMIAQLLADHETIIKQIRADIDATQQVNDMGTNNFLCDLIEKHEKMAWMLRAHLE